MISEIKSNIETTSIKTQPIITTKSIKTISRSKQVSKETTMSSKIQSKDNRKLIVKRPKTKKRRWTNKEI